MRRTIFAGAKLLRPIHLLLALIAALLWLVWRKTDDAKYTARNALDLAVDVQHHVLIGHCPDADLPLPEDSFGYAEAQERIRDLEHWREAIEDTEATAVCKSAENQQKYRDGVEQLGRLFNIPKKSATIEDDIKPVFGSALGLAILSLQQEVNSARPDSPTS